MLNLPMKSRMESKKTNVNIFGTDGVRGQTGIFPLDNQSIFRLGKAIARVAGQLNQDRSYRFIFGRDTRGSGIDIESTLAAGIKEISPKAVILSLGVIPTPGLSYVTRSAGYDYGIMITASHNPYTDNGIKIFGSSGEKIPDSMEDEIQFEFYRPEQDTSDSSERIEVQAASKAEKNLYTDFLKTHGREAGQSGFHVVIDCANGATYEAAPYVFESCGFKVTPIHTSPDGKNINLNCGSTHPEKLRERVVASGADYGIAFDGDGDRVLLVDGRGRLLDGDYTLLFLARHFLTQRSDFNRKVVGTVMGNMALEKALEKLDIHYIRTGVGDRQVAAEMKATGAILGGEQSGHTIISCFQPSGDGILTALTVLQALHALGISSQDAAEELSLFPQELRGFKVKEKPAIDEWSELQKMLQEFERKNGEDSRVLIRYSGTEPKIRIMMESRRSQVIDENMDRFEAFIRSAIGAESLS